MLNLSLCMNGAHRHCIDGITKRVVRNWGEKIGSLIAPKELSRPRQSQNFISQDFMAVAA